MIRVHFIPRALLCAILASSAFGQPGSPARIDLRIVTQVGSPYEPAALGGVIDLSGTEHVSVSALRPELRRFEVQYRVMDTRPDDAVGIACMAQIIFSIEAVNASPQSTLGRALLSRDEIQSANLISPAATVDISGRPDPIWDLAAGLHRPYRYISVPRPSNDSPHNGRPNRGSSGGTPIPGNSRFSEIRGLLVDTNMAQPDGVVPEWFGLYSFDWTPGRDYTADQTVTFRTRATSSLVFLQDQTLPIDIPLPEDAVSSLRVVVPTPPTWGTWGLAAIALGIRPRRRAARFWR